jgi:uncharacterized protein YjbJ (UPF0337 family)
MKWDQIGGKWMEFRNRVMYRWGELTDQDILTINGKRETLAGKIRERTGAAKDQVEKEIAEFEASCNCSRPSAGTP